MSIEKNGRTACVRCDISGRSLCSDPHLGTVGSDDAIRASFESNSFTKSRFITHRPGVGKVRDCAPEYEAILHLVRVDERLLSERHTPDGKYILYDLIDESSGEVRTIANIIDPRNGRRG